MRIRKRQVPFPLSSLSPVPLSDPHPIHPSPVVQLNDAPPPKSNSIPLLLQQRTDTALTTFRLDHPHPLLPMRKPTDARDSSPIAMESGAHKHYNKQDSSDEDGRGRDGGGEKHNDTRRGGILGSDTATEVVPLPPSCPSNLDGRWCEGEKAIPLKKRRGRGGDYMNMRENNSTNNNKRMKTRMKTKMNKKCYTQNDNEKHGEEEEERKEDVNVNVSKKRGRGSGVMEGSRCSRVNGRGWRCCQQTLVGYSLCEHHLGKGRLRSITSVRSRSIPPPTTTTATKNNDSPSVDPVWGASSSSPDKQSKCDSLGIHNTGDHKDEKKPVMITKKRMKLGMVKARSISSLLGQPNTQITLSENNK